MCAVLLGLALCIGVVTASVTAGLPAFLPMLFTPDRRLWPLMRTVAPQVPSSPVPYCGLEPLVLVYTVAHVHASLCLCTHSLHGGLAFTSQAGISQNQLYIPAVRSADDVLVLHALYLSSHACDTPVMYERSTSNRCPNGCG